MSAGRSNKELPTIVCTHCYLVTRADMPRCLYCGTVLHHPAMPHAHRRGVAKEGHGLPGPAPRKARAGLSPWR
jgi:hypothetical protein